MPLIDRRCVVRLAVFFFALMSLFPAYASADITHNLVGWWKLDEGTSTYAHDSSGLKHNAFLTSTSTLPQWVSGKFGSALQFDGSTNFVNNNAFALDAGSTSIATSTFTIAMWFKLANPVSAASPGHTMTLFSLSDQASNNDVFLTIGNRTDIGICTNGQICGSQYTGHTWAEVSSSTQTSWAANTWYHVAYTYATSSDMAIYINGALSATTTNGTGRGPLAAQHSSIGGNSDYLVGSNSFYFFNGSLDDVRVYTRALSAADIAQLYNETQSFIRKPANNLGMVGWWKFDEGTSTTAHDLSGNGHNATTSSTGSVLPQWVSGRFGKALQFDGSTNYAQATQDGSFKLSGQAFTISAWLADTHSVVAISGTYDRAISWYDGSKNIQLGIGVNVGATQKNVYIQNDSVNSAPKQVSTTALDLSFHHVVATFDGASTYHIYVDGLNADGGSSPNNVLPVTSNSKEFIIGQRGDSAAFFQGSIDDVRIYNRVLSPYEVANLYQTRAAKVASTADLQNGSSLTNSLIAYYTFDGKDTPWSSATAGTAIDRSGNGNNGTLTNMTRSGSPTIGKIGQAFNFNANSYIQLPGNGFTTGTHPWTLSAWVKPTSNANFDGNAHYIAQYDSTGVANETPVILLDVGGFPEVSSFLGTPSNDCPSATAAVVGKWMHIVGEYDGTNEVLYVNGKLDRTCTGITSNIVMTNPPLIGDNSGGSFQGVIDDVRIYNRALTDREVKQLYKLGQTTQRP